ncbi:cob(I)yrinic acid a,c-diamide adenosyltransferase [Candidatus Woesearchaeota archaeon]|jgi:cob(I)alamin adenosyltransferase|nr:cob(I)yrinic acid a,c-diamide adenosyltransferase [Candidatus Woesearchaeota archaeon]MBT5272718.1 cob(I)yrinic acid a,c-diamide adenosyltransferase [Candidatus Woesearchaeota archaeon]MBT6040329.1 cob(I)yrinic acid a,c-diamide adenosyltransferase [Candidatus Woesearchaeota archaeon]MBT6337037.1 cob(I)yrinic acid a,c-diamide adenosyltransferase [Candidatus Woesearchaeota archaeon]MBT7927909.1 cob(I)yrinic acid a,c-diamide adenosyltransferase [Candidatus Woesearchaeota archaeon]
MVPRKFGFVHVYTGDGKGKTTAAMGLALRAIGQGFKVFIIQFLKGGAYTGEFISMKNFLPKENKEIVQFGEGCVKELKQFKLQGFQKGARKENCEYFDYIREDIECGNCRECFLDDEKQKKSSREAFALASDILSSEKYDLVVLDEINNAISHKYISVNEVIELIQKKAPRIELVLTGRCAPPEIIQVADLVTEMKCIKHYYENGVFARRGIEY